ncbi:hypothetical protein DASC09_054220 [Saccharomycopsis crataegensis]|uniref:Uncharacterized protein n=1 Tax=Saccharomycopsis crataegensis TaxID=43959 RepID=A0AAV5QT95_9ASCO|nr:hypothetical protein DASC09_054220 [Saccharomycopsis crataegensis]
MFLNTITSLLDFHKKNASKIPSATSPAEISLLITNSCNTNNQDKINSPMEHELHLPNSSSIANSDNSLSFGERVASYMSKSRTQKAAYYSFPKHRHRFESSIYSSSDITSITSITPSFNISNVFDRFANVFKGKILTKKNFTLFVAEVAINMLSEQGRIGHHLELEHINSCIYVLWRTLELCQQGAVIDITNWDFCEQAEKSSVVDDDDKPSIGNFHAVNGSSIPNNVDDEDDNQNNLVSSNDSPQREDAIVDNEPVYEASINDQFKNFNNLEEFVAFANNIETSNMHIEAKVDNYLEQHQLIIGDEYYIFNDHGTHRADKALPACITIALAFDKCGIPIPQKSHVRFLDICLERYRDPPYNIPKFLDVKIEQCCCQGKALATFVFIARSYFSNGVRIDQYELAGLLHGIQEQFEKSCGRKNDSKLGWEGNSCSKSHCLCKNSGSANNYLSNFHESFASPMGKATIEKSLTISEKGSPLLKKGLQKKRSISKKKKKKKNKKKNGNKKKASIRKQPSTIKGQDKNIDATDESLTILPLAMSSPIEKNLEKAKQEKPNEESLTKRNPPRRLLPHCLL